MASAWYLAKKPATVTKTAAYLPGKWGEERQKEYGNLSFLTQRLGSVRTHSFIVAGSALEEIVEGANGA